MSCCEQACVVKEFRPHRLENSAQCGVDTRMCWSENIDWSGLSMTFIDTDEVGIL